MPMCGGTPAQRTGEFFWKRRPDDAGRFAESGRDWRRVFQHSDDEERGLHRRRHDADRCKRGKRNRRRNRRCAWRILTIARCEKRGAAVMRHVGCISMNTGVQLRRNAQDDNPKKRGRNDRGDDRAKRIHPRMPGRSAHHGAELLIVAVVKQGKFSGSLSTVQQMSRAG
jgi:hypothetical protein